MADLIRIYLVVGELSGDKLGASLLEALDDRSVLYEAEGLAGPALQAKGIKSPFDLEDISAMGISQVVGALPKIMRRVKQTVDEILRFDPDVIVLIDGQEFCNLVAKRIRKKKPYIKIVKYVCPSVWAWRQGRAKNLGKFVDLVLAILPFEPELMRRLGGPKTVFVGHPIAPRARKFTNRTIPGKPPQLLLLPGSRGGEISKMLPVFHDVIDQLIQRGFEGQYSLLAVEHFQDRIAKETKSWGGDIEILSGERGRQQAFQSADVALACSGTVTLELAVEGIPTISLYKLDQMAYLVRRMIKAWSLSLPNLIADQPVFPEYYNEYIKPGHIARLVEVLCTEGAARSAQVEGMRKVCNALTKAGDPHIAADAIVELVSANPSE